MYKISIILVFVTFCFTACNQASKEVHYKYGEVVIKRVDKAGETSFYYLGRNSKNSSGKIWAQYSGINDGFSGYLRFHKNGKVEILSSDGYFQSNVADSNKFSFKEMNEKMNLGDSVCIIMLSARHEIERNKLIKTRVKVSYKEL